MSYKFICSQFVFNKEISEASPKGGKPGQIFLRRMFPYFESFTAVENDVCEDGYKLEIWVANQKAAVRGALRGESEKTGGAWCDLDE